VKRTKKILITAVLTTVVLAGSIGGAVMAADNDTEDTRPAGHLGMLEKVCEIYEDNTGDAIDVAALQAAFEAAREEMRPEMPPRTLHTEAVLERLQALLEEGKMTQEQYDEFAAWVDAMPDESDTEAYQEWLESSPNIHPSGPAGHGGRHGFGRDGGMPPRFGERPCAPEATE
jgi:hypothetical protein